MSDAYDRLEDAIHDYIKDVEDKTVGSWILSWEATTITNDPDLVPLVGHTGNVLGEGTTISRALGLLDVAKLYLRNILTAAQEAEND